MAKKRNGGSFRGLYLLTSMGTHLVGSTFAGFLIGYYLDKYFNTKPWLMMIFLVLGIAAGFMNMYRSAKKYGS
ncbi:MAG: hypothetical protein BMS9Abin23_0776 [Thermodesulfobacteriota bacterium]|nr:MAG: hypothetical protein BMS9Abin23_0776 [Thermodesulfobacteriota bacterium]